MFIERATQRLDNRRGWCGCQPERQRDSEQGEIKIFDPDGSRGAAYIKKAFYQAYQYCLDYNEPMAYLIVFNVSKRQLRVELPADRDGQPRWEYNNKTIFLIVIDLHEHEGTASTRGVAETVTIATSELIREVEESKGTNG